MQEVLGDNLDFKLISKIDTEKKIQIEMKYSQSLIIFISFQINFFYSYIYFISGLGKFGYKVKQCITNLYYSLKGIHGILYAKLRCLG